MEKRKQLIVISAPSGAGKSTLARHILSVFPNFVFSISATTRKPRPNEVDGKDYFFVSKDEFEKLVKNNELIEYEQIFDNYYGTLKSQVDKNLEEGKVVVFDIDVKGALSIKQKYPSESFLIFIAPPSIDAIKERLVKRGTETTDDIEIRLSRINTEMELKDRFDFVLINDDLEKAKEELAKKITEITNTMSNSG
ncbi:MAG: guanylate kinase [Ignavibacteria bacterium]|nr:guanylate kinase [Ignavibacteria bacterium]